MAVEPTIRRSVSKARRLIPLAAALLLAALVSIPASNLALAQTPPGNDLTLINTDREFVERKRGGEFVARPIFDRKLQELFYAIRDADTGDWISAMYQIPGGLEILMSEGFQGFQMTLFEEES